VRLDTSTAEEMKMDTDLLHKSKEAATELLKGVADSDFVSEYGTNAAYGLREYKVDMAVDIAQAFLNRLLTDEEREWLAKAEWSFPSVR
jgi:hypothetical protein